MTSVPLSRLATVSLVISVILGGLFLLLLAEKYRPRPWARGLPWVILAIYLLGFFSITLLFRRPFRLRRLVRGLFWSYRQAFSLSLADGIQVERLGLAREILLNILLTVPLGYLLPGLLRKRRRPALLTLGAGFLLSAVTECLQYFLRLGYFELDDLLNNTLGCLLGLLIWRLCLCAVGRAEARLSQD